MADIDSGARSGVYSKTLLAVLVVSLAVNLLILGAWLGDKKSRHGKHNMHQGRHDMHSGVVMHDYSMHAMPAPHLWNSQLMIQGMTQGGRDMPGAGNWQASRRHTLSGWLVNRAGHLLGEAQSQRLVDLRKALKAARANLRSTLKKPANVKAVQAALEQTGEADMQLREAVYDTLSTAFASADEDKSAQLMRLLRKHQRRARPRHFEGGMRMQPEFEGGMRMQPEFDDGMRMQPEFEGGGEHHER